MRKYGFCGITLLVAIVFTGCGDRDTEKDILENIPDVADEVESDTSSKEMPSSLSSEEPEGELFADKENLPEEMEEGEAAMVAYNNSDETIVETIPDASIDLGLLREKNSDVSAYIIIPGTSINNPILKKNDSNEYYLKHNAENEEDSNGCIFMDMGNEIDFTDPVTCLYAKSGEGQPFGDLVAFSDPDFMNENKYIYIYSDEYISQYKIFAAYSTDDTERPLVKYNFYDFSEYQQYIDEVFSVRDMTAVIDNDLKDKALTTWNTITLIGIDNDGSRQLVQAVFNGRTTIN